MERTDDEDIKKRRSMAERWVPIKPYELELFIATQIAMNIHELPTTRDHWSDEFLFGSPASMFINLWRYESIRTFLFTSEVGKKGIDKVKDIIEYIMHKSQFYYYPGK